MKPRLTLICLALLVLATTSPVLAAPADKPANSSAQSAKLADLRRQHAVNEAEIKQLKAKIKADTDRKAAQAIKDKAKEKRDSISEMSEADTLFLQQLMEKKSQLEQMISNTMKASSE